MSRHELTLSGGDRARTSAEDLSSTRSTTYFLLYHISFTRMLIYDIHGVLVRELVATPYHDFWPLSAHVQASDSGGLHLAARPMRRYYHGKGR